MKILLQKLLIWYIILISNSINYFGNYESFCGVREQQYSWSFECHKKPMEKFLTDLGLDDTEAELLTDELFELFSFHEKDVQWKINIIHIGSSIEIDYDDKAKDIDTCKIRYSLARYHKENDENAKHTIIDYETINLYERNSYVYAHQYLYHEIGFYSFEVYHALGFFVASDIKWNSVVSEINDIIKENDASDDYSVRTLGYNFFQEKGIISIYKNDDITDLKEFIAVDKFTENGIMYEKTLAYNKEYIYKFELQDIFYNKFLQENWLILLIITILIIIGLLYIYFKKIRP